MHQLHRPSFLLFSHKVKFALMPRPCLNTVFQDRSLDRASDGEHLLLRQSSVKNQDVLIKSFNIDYLPIKSDPLFVSVDFSPSYYSCTLHFINVQSNQLKIYKSEEQSCFNIIKYLTQCAAVFSIISVTASLCLQCQLNTAVQ